MENLENSEITHHEIHPARKSPIADPRENFRECSSKISHQKRDFGRGPLRIIEHELRAAWIKHSASAGVFVGLSFDGADGSCKSDD